jgi:hypothetical protein
MAYAQFYENSIAERKLVNRTQGQILDDADIVELSRKQLETFQQAFAEWSGGSGDGHELAIRACDFRRFLMGLGVELSLAQSRSLWSCVESKEGSTCLAYGDALLAYRKVLSAPLKFRNQPNAAPPGKSIEDAKIDSSMAQEDESAIPSKEHRRSFSGNSTSRSDSIGDHRGHCSGLAARKGLCIPIQQARELLLAEDLHGASAEAFLRPYASDLVVPQEALFDYLAKEAGMQHDDKVGAPSSPAGRKCAPKAPPLLGAPPVLA